MTVDVNGQPRMERKRTGLSAMLSLIGFTTLLSFTYRRVWHGQR